MKKDSDIIDIETGSGASYSYDVAEKSAKLEALEQLYSFVLTPNKR